MLPNINFYTSNNSNQKRKSLVSSQQRRTENVKNE